MDNFNTRHDLAEDGEAMAIRTVKITNVDGTNKIKLDWGQ